MAKKSEEVDVTSLIEETPEQTVDVTSLIEDSKKKIQTTPTNGGSAVELDAGTSGSEIGGSEQQPITVQPENISPYSLGVQPQSVTPIQAYHPIKNRIEAEDAKRFEDGTGGDGIKGTLENWYHNIDAAGNVLLDATKDVLGFPQRFADQTIDLFSSGVKKIGDALAVSKISPWTPEELEKLTPEQKKLIDKNDVEKSAHALSGAANVIFGALNVIEAPAMMALSGSTESAGKLIGEDAVQNIMAPVSSALGVTEDSSELAKLGASIGDLITVGAVLHSANKGIGAKKIADAADRFKENKATEEDINTLHDFVSENPETINEASKQIVEGNHKKQLDEIPQPILDLGKQHEAILADAANQTGLAKKVLEKKAADLAEKHDAEMKAHVEAQKAKDDILALEKSKQGLSKDSQNAIDEKIAELQKQLPEAKEEITEQPTSENEKTEEPKEDIYYTGRKNKNEDLSNIKGEFVFFSKDPSISEWHGGDNVHEAKINTSSFLDLTTPEKKADFVKEQFTDRDIQELYPDLKTRAFDDRDVRLSYEQKLQKLTDEYRERLMENRFSGDGKEQQFLLNKIKEKGYPGVKLLDSHFGKNDISYVVIDKNEINKSSAKSEAPKEDETTNPIQNESETKINAEESSQINSEKPIGESEVGGNQEEVLKVGGEQQAPEITPIAENTITDTPEAASETRSVENTAGQKKSLLNRGYEGVTDENIKSSIEKHGLTYEVESHETAKQNANKFIEDVGIENALKAVKDNKVEDGAAAFVWGKLIDDVGKKLLKSTDPAEQQELTKVQAELISEFDKKSRSSGRFVSALKDVYENSDFEYNYESQIEKYKSINNGEITPEVEAKFRAYDEELKTLNKKIIDLENKNKDHEAKSALENIVRESRKQKRTITKEALRDERKVLLDELAEIAKKQRGTLSSNPIPVEMIPVIAKLTRNYIETGVVNLADVVDKVHYDLKDYVDGITTRDVRDAITGYGKEPKRQTRNELTESINELKRQGKLVSRLEDLEAGNKPLKSERTKAAESEEVAALKEKIKQVYKDQGFAQEEKLSSLKTRIKNKTEELQERLNRGDFETPKREKLQLDEEALNLEIAKNKVKEKFDVEVEKARLNNRSTKEKIYDTVLEAGGALKSFAASADLSAPLRQGAILSFANPKAASKATVEMFRQAFSEKSADKWLQKLKNSPEYPLIKDSKLYISEPTTRLTAKEERFMTNLPSKIPYLKHLFKGSERAYTGYLNKLRVDVFADGVDALKEKGLDPKKNPEEFKAWADFINNATGRGSLGALEKSAVVLNNVFFSPRYVASRFNLLNPITYASMPPETRKMAMKNVLSYLGVGSAVVALSAAAGADVELDPRSADFGKIKIGDTRVDVWAGEQQWVRLMSQILSGQRKSTTTGKVSDLAPDVFPNQTRLDVTGSFFRSKLAPAASLAADLMSGKTAMGEPLDAKEMAIQKVVPLYLQDMYELYSEEDPEIAAGLTLPALFGAGVQHYENKGLSQQSLEDLFKKRKEPVNHKTPAELKEIHDRKEKLEYDRKQAAKKLGIDYVPPKNGGYGGAPKDDKSGMKITPAN